MIAASTTRAERTAIEVIKSHMYRIIAVEHAASVEFEVGAFSAKMERTRRPQATTTGNHRRHQLLVEPSSAPWGVLCFLILICHSQSYFGTAAAPIAATPLSTWRLIERAAWGARDAENATNFTGPAPFAIVHHSYQPGVCRTQDACKASMRSMQNFHMDGHGWEDIGYSFAVGGDGNVYEGRGFNVVGAHAPNYNSRSVGLLLIGNFVDVAPPAPMMQVAQEFLQYAVNVGALREDYILHGHRQVRSTECPGAALYAVVQQWPHWQNATE